MPGYYELGDEGVGQQLAQGGLRAGDQGARGRERLEHVILSHHTLREFGACATPATPEAVFVARIDDLDAKMSAVEEELRKAPQGQEFVPVRGIDGHLLTTPPRTGA